MDQSQLSDIDHYKFRPARTLDIQGQVRLQGQFDDVSWPANLRRLELIGSPAIKSHHDVDTPIRYADLHLAAYRLDTQPQPARTVQVQNQFTGPGWKQLRIGNPELLLVPATKQHDTDEQEDPPKPAYGQHYACYQVLDDPPELNARVRLQDQFDREPRPAIVRQPVYLAVPVLKEYGNHPSAPHWNEDVHLVLYTITSRVRIHDQFGPRPVDMVSAPLLGVPSFKERLQ